MNRTIRYVRFAAAGVLPALLVVLFCGFPTSANGMPVDQTSLDAAFATLSNYQWGPQRDALLPIDLAAARCHNEPGVRQTLEERLIAVLESDATQAAQAYACEILAQIGSARSVPALSRLLVQPDTSHASRLALESIADPAAPQALRTALPDLPRDLKLGVVHSLGRLGDAQSVDLLVPLLRGDDLELLQAAAIALASIPAVRAGDALVAFYQESSVESQSLVADACLVLASRKLAAGRLPEAARIYRLLQRSPRPHVRWASFQGLIAAEPQLAHERLIQELTQTTGPDDQRARMIGQLIRETVTDENVERFAQSIDRLPAAGQLVVLDALSGRNDLSVRNAALACLADDSLSLRLSAAKALTSCGLADDVVVLASLAATSRYAAERRTAIETLRSMSGPDIDRRILALMPDAEQPVQVVLIRTIANRRVDGAGAMLLEAARSPHAEVRLETFRALQVVADPALADELVDLLAKTSEGEEREAADRAVWRCCQKISEPAGRTAPLLARLKRATVDEQLALLPALGRIGGDEALAVVQSAMDDADARVRNAAIRALTNWPDAAVAEQLWEIATRGDETSQRIWALRGLARVLPQLADQQPDDVAARLGKAMAIAQREDDKRLILSRLAAVRAEGSLALAISCLDDPALRNDAIDAAVELGEAMKDTHPQAARSALEKIAPLVENPELGMHISKILWNMQLKGH